MNATAKQLRAQAITRFARNDDSPRISRERWTAIADDYTRRAAETEARARELDSEAFDYRRLAALATKNAGA